MKRRIAMLLSAAVLAGSVAVFSSASPASATLDDVCVGEGTATLTGTPPTGFTGFTYPVIGHLKLASFTFNFALGTCLTKLALTATGTVHGWCGFSVGEGTTTNGYYFQWQGVGGTLVLTAGLPGLLAFRLYGVVNAAPNALAGDSCTTGADDFLVNGLIILVS